MDKETMQKLGWSPELIEAITDSAKKVSESAVSVNYSVEEIQAREPVDSNSLVLSNTRNSGSNSIVINKPAK